MARTTPKAKYDQITVPGIATKAMTADEFIRLPLMIPFLTVSRSEFRPFGFAQGNSAAFDSFPQAPSGVVQEQVLEAGLQDVDSAQLNTCRQSRAGNFRHQLAAAIRVQVSAVVIAGAHFAHARQRLQTLQQL